MTALQGINEELNHGGTRREEHGDTRRGNNYRNYYSGQLRVKLCATPW